MRLNQGIQKYRETARTSEPKARKTAEPAAPTSASPTSKAPAKAAAAEKSGKLAKSGKPDKEEEAKHAAKSATLAKGAALAKNAALTKTPVLPTGTNGKKTAQQAEVEEAADEIVAAEEAAKEEAALQTEIAQELEREAPQTAQLVKEDFSPTNSTRERLVTEYAALIKYIAQKIAARLPANIELDDLISSGVIGLMDAIEKYDATRDNKFKTYAEFRIRGAILDELRAQDWVPRSVREKAKVLERCYNKIEQQKGRQATDEEVCSELGITQNDYHDLLNQVRSVSLLSYDDILNFSKSDKRSLHGLGEGGTRVPTPFSEVNVASVKRMVSEAIRDLPEKQRLVLSLYYYEDLNLKEIGRVLDVTESRVSQLHTQAIIRLKAKLKNHWDEFHTLFG